MNRREMWVQVVNPARAGHETDRRYSQLVRWHDRADTYLWAVGIVVAAVVFTVLALVAPAWVAGPVAAGGAAATVVVGRRRYRRALESARGAVQELDDMVGLASVSRSSLVDPTVRALADRAMVAQARILGSAAYRQGSLGEPDAVAGQVAAITWQSVYQAVQFDQLVLSRARLAAEIRGWRIPNAVIAFEAGQADQVLAERRQSLEAATVELAALADLVVGLDGQLLAEAARDALRGVTGAATESAVALPDSLADDLAARISAAHNVLDVGGYTPPKLPPRM